MDLGFIINQLAITASTDEEVQIAKGKNKVITNWAEVKQQIKWQLKKQ
jgi:hypothetical protein